MRQRTIGPVGPSVSQVSYGTMRLREKVDGRSAAVLLGELHDAGIDTHHSSAEYDTHGLYLEALKQAKATGRSFKHIVKLSSPNWDDLRFQPSSFTAAVDQELSTLGAEQLASVQWLVRTKEPNNTENSVRILTEQRDEIRATFQGLISSGKVGDISIFPYQADIIPAAVGASPTRTLCAYLNLDEAEHVDRLDSIDAFLAIRPLAAGAFTEPEAVASALRWPLLHPCVATIIVSTNQQAHVQQLLMATAGVEPDRTLFRSELSRLWG